MPIGLGAATLIAGLGGATAGAATGIYGAKKQTGAANEAARLQVEAANRAAELEAKAAADQLEFTKAQAAKDEARYETDRYANYETNAARERRMGSLGQMLGLGDREIPDYVPSGSGVPGGASSPSSGGAAALKALLDQGVDPQQAVAQYNEQYQPGPNSRAVYYGPEVHGKATIGIPEAYLSLEDTGWGITDRKAAGGGAGAPVRRMGTLGAMVGRPVLTPRAVPGSLGSMVGY